MEPPVVKQIFCTGWARACMMYQLRRWGDVLGSCLGGAWLLAIYWTVHFSG